MSETTYDRRGFMGYFASIGLGGTLLPGVLWAKVSEGADITKETIACAEEIAGVAFDDKEREAMVEGLRQQKQQIDQLHAIHLENAVAPAIVFNPLPPGHTDVGPKPGPARATRMVRSAVPDRARPANLDDLAFLTVNELARLVKRRVVTSTELTQMYLARLKRYDPVLHAVVTLTEDRALAQAKAMDAEIAAGKYRGPLHGIPWGAKDLIAAKGYRTTWGAGPFQQQTFDEDATVVQRLDAAGAVLVAKLATGELAQGDRWFGGMTRNPWKPEQGASGSSAGPGSAVSAGLVGFAIGSETLGSISSPSTRNGVTGLRPTFGRVPRTGAMALSWTMDKLGPICRSAEDCAIVLDAIHGPDGRDLACIAGRPFRWDATVKPSSLRVGYFKAAFDVPEIDPKDDKGQRRIHPTKKFDDAALDALRGLGVSPVALDVPDAAYNAMRLILTAEAGAAFDELVRSGKVKELSNQEAYDWPNTFREARFIPAVDYINANRVRTLAIQQWDRLFRDVDVIATPTGYGGGVPGQLTATNLTGHPAVICPSGFNPDGTPVSITFLGGLFEEAKLLAVANAWQRATGWHLQHPVVKV